MEEIKFEKSVMDFLCPEVKALFKGIGTHKTLNVPYRIR
jgi:hypothetical protein